jgi:hypothetical protein
VKNSGITKVISLFFRSPNHRRPRISAENEFVDGCYFAAKTASPAARVRMFAAPACTGQ